MSSPIPWPDFTALTTPMEKLVALSRFYGSDPSFAIAGGGNTSVKDGNRLHVKGSGTSLAEITPAGFVEMDREALDALLSSMGTNIAGLLALHVEDEEIVHRIKLRGATSGRPDDTDEQIIRNRLAVYKNDTSPVFGYYTTKGKSHKINGVGSISDIFERLTTAIDEL